jgi:hypothetical protein
MVVSACCGATRQGVGPFHLGGAAHPPSPQSTRVPNRITPKRGRPDDCTTRTRADDPSGVTEWTADSDVAASGEEAVLTIENLEPGEYAMVCFIPAPDGQPHAFLGMAVGFTVE